MHEVYAYGVIAPSTLIELQDEFPPTAGYAEIAGVHPSVGGEAAGGAYVLARLGVSTKLSGTKLSDDPGSQRVIGVLSSAGVDCGAIATDAPSAVTEIVFASEGERTIFGTYGRMHADSAWSQPSRGDIESSMVVCLDPFFGSASVQAAQWCHEASIPYVTVDARTDSNVARLAEVVVISEEFAVREFPSMDRHQLMAAYTESCDGLVILTGGGGPLLYGRRNEEPRVFTPYAVEARDTAGAGDSFRAGIIYGMLKGHDEDRMVQTASAVAALVCERAPGVLNSPNARELEEFLQRQG